MAATSKTRVTRAERHEQVARMHEMGFTFKQIAEDLGLSQSTVTSAYYDPTGDKDRARKAKRHGHCKDCGTEVYNSGSIAIQERCQPCRTEWQRTDPEYVRKSSQRLLGKHLTYTRNQILDMLREASPDGGLTGDQYNAWRQDHGGASEPLIIRRFDTWQKALKAAGLRVDHPRGRYANRTPNEAILDMLWACARDLGRRPSFREYDEWQRDRPWAVSPQTVRNRLRSWHKATELAGLNNMNGGTS